MHINADTTALVVVDVQERLVAATAELLTPRLSKINLLLRAAAAINLDVIVTEQYPKGLGSTLPELKELFAPSWPVIEKTSFSCFGEEKFRDALKSKKRQTVALLGIECHVCVQQTAFDLLADGYDVILLVDAVASRKSEDMLTAIELMRSQGVKVTTAESFLFALLGGAKHPGFKAVSALVK